MSSKIQSKPPGIEDIFPDRIEAWNFILDNAREVFSLYNYKEVILPVFEYTDVFVRGLGTETDIVSKEMFSFEDRGGRSLTLRPEGTAGMARAYVENGDYNRLSTAKFYYSGQMFRAERPQKGRLRQFNQFGAEIFGSMNPYYDFEIISMMDAIIQRLGIVHFELLINSIGCSECRVNYINELKKYYKSNFNVLCEDCKRRLDRNPLRLLDCKNEKCIELKKGAPLITSFICEACEEHHILLKDFLKNSSIHFREDPRLVRGLDYYTKTTFEFISDKLGGQNAFAAGGRYDNLIEQFGGKTTPAVGFAAGMERILLLLDDKKIERKELGVFLVYSGEAAYKKAVEIITLLRSNNISADLVPGSTGIKAQFKKADRENAKLTIIIGGDEIQNKNITIKRMDTGEQEKVAEGKIIERINNLVGL